MNTYDTYIFDLDGTLLYTLGDLTASVNHALEVYGIAGHSVDEVRQMVGNGIRKLIELAIPGGARNPQYESVYKTFMEHYLAHSMDTTRPYEGIIATLAALKRAGKRMAIVSNKRSDATEHLRRHFFSRYIDVAIGESESVRRKPAPDTVYEALRRLGTTKDGAVYVGDSEVDLQTAQNSGIPCISVLWGFRDKCFLAAHGATTFIFRPEELLPATRPGNGSIQQL
ncbi:MAG: HAD family hydrolase [Prevotella sp.]|nr:HAD family hydrolase [Prevotella sp.]